MTYSIGQGNFSVLIGEMSKVTGDTAFSFALIYIGSKEHKVD